jgi:hypothetical protein
VLVGDIVSPPKFDPKPAIVAIKGDFVACYDQARRGNPNLHGKLNLQITVNELAAVTHVDGLGPAADPALVACLSDALKQAHFPKPPGVAIITAPLVFRP